MAGVPSGSLQAYQGHGLPIQGQQQGATTQLPEAVDQGFTAVLSALTGSRVSAFAFHTWLSRAGKKLLDCQVLVDHWIAQSCQSIAVCSRKSHSLLLQDSIKTSKEWFMASVAHVDGLAAKMAAHLQTLASYEKQLHIIYLANDVLLKRSAACLILSVEMQLN